MKQDGDYEYAFALTMSECDAIEFAALNWGEQIPWS